MQTGDCAGFGEQPNASVRRSPFRINAVRALWVGGLVVAGSVLGAASANAAEADQVDEPTGDLLGSLTAAVEPLTSAVEPVSGLADSLVGEAETVLGEADSLVGGAETVLGDDLSLSEDLRGDGSPLEEVQVTELVDEPLTELTSAVGLDDGTAAEQAASSADREAAAASPDRSHDRSKDANEPNVAADGSPEAEPANDESLARDLRRLLGSTDSLLATVDGVPSSVMTDGGEPARQLTDTLTGVLSTEQEFGTLEAVDPLSTVAGVVSLLDLPHAGGLHVLDPLAPVLDSVIRTVPDMASIDPLLGSSDLREAVSLEPSAAASVVPALQHTPTASAETVPVSPSSGHGTARLTGNLGSEPAAAHISLAASPDERPDSTREILRPSLPMTPVAGFTAMHAGAPGVALSADQAGPSSHALLPEEAVLRARLFSAAAYARNIEVKPLREANDPPVSPD